MEATPLTREEFEALGGGRSGKHIEMLREFLASGDDVWKLTDTTKSASISLSRLVRKHEFDMTVATRNGEIYLVRNEESTDETDQG